MSQLSTHLTCTGKNKKNVNNPIWEWVFLNLGQVADILKMNIMVNNYVTLALYYSDEGLFQPLSVKK